MYHTTKSKPPHTQQTNTQTFFTMSLTTDYATSGLASFLRVFGSKAFKGMVIAIFGNDTPQIGEVVATLGHLGAEVFHYSNSFNPFGQIFNVNQPSFRLTSDLCVCHRVPDLILDYFGKVTTVIIEGVKAEEEFKNTGILPDLTSTDDVELQLAVIKIGLKTNPNRYNEIKNKLIGVCEMTTEGAKRAYQMQANGSLPFPVINVNGSIDKSKFGNLEGLAPSILDCLKAQNAHYAHQLISDHLIASQITSVNSLRNRLDNNGLSDLLNYNGHNLLEEAKLNFNIQHYFPEEAQLPHGFIIRGKTVVVCGYGDKGKCAAVAMRRAGAHVTVTEINPRRAYQAVMEGFKVCNLEDVVQTADVIITATGKKGTIMVSDMMKMKDNMIVMDIGHFDNEIDMAELEACSCVQKVSTRHGFICYFPETKNAIRVLVLPNSEPTSYTQTMGVIGLLALQGAKDIGKYKKEVYVLSKDYDEMVAALHLEQHGAKLTKGSTSYITGSTSCTTVALDGQEYLRKRKASLMNRLALPEMKFKCA